jgi:hypothetical protein
VDKAMTISPIVVIVFAIWGLISAGMQAVYLYQKWTYKIPPVQPTKAEIENEFLKNEIEELKKDVAEARKRAQDIEDKVVGRLLQAKTQAN